MARLFFDGFESGTANLWDYLHLPNGLNGDSEITGTYSLQRGSTVYKDFEEVDIYDLYVGFWIKFGSATGQIYIEPCILGSNEELFENGRVELLGTYNSLSGEGSITFSIYTNSLIREVYTIEQILYPTNNVQVRMKSNQDDSVLVQIKLNGEQVLNETISGSSKVNAGSGEYISRLQLRTTNSSYYTFIDDVVMENADWPGPSKIYGLAPNAAGSSTVWQPSSGDNYECVNSIPPSQNSYVTTPDALDLDLYSIGNLPSGITTIKGVQVFGMAKTPGPPSLEYLQLAIRTGSSNFYSSSKRLYYNYRTFLKAWETNPNTGNSWTSSEVNDLQAGMRLVSS